MPKREARVASCNPSLPAPSPVPLFWKASFFEKTPSGLRQGAVEMPLRKGGKCRSAESGKEGGGPIKKKHFPPSARRLPPLFRPASCFFFLAT